MRLLNLQLHKTAYKLSPRHEWVLVEKKTPDEKKTAEGVIVDMSQAKSYRAIVLEVGEKVADLKPGDEVLMTGFPMDIEDVEELVSGEEALTDPSLRRKVYLVREEEIYCRIEERD